jgi:hypothetical protein
LFFPFKHCLKPKNNVLAVSNNVFSQKIMCKRKKQCSTGKNIRKIRRSPGNAAASCASGPARSSPVFPENKDVFGQQARGELFLAEPSYPSPISSRDFADSALRVSLCSSWFELICPTRLRTFWQAADRAVRLALLETEDPIDVLHGCLKDLPEDPLAELEAEHRAEIEADERSQPKSGFEPRRACHRALMTNSRSSKV